MALAGRCDRILRIADGLVVGDERMPHAKGRAIGAAEAAQ